MESRKAKTRTVAMVVLCGILVYALIATGGSLEPSAPPGPTMKTLDEIYNKPIWNMLDKEFVDWPNNPRFAVCDNGTPADERDDMVLDKETGLVWTRNANLLYGFGPPGRQWVSAISCCRNEVTIGNRKGWRLPTHEELSSLVDPSQTVGLKLPSGHPFINVQSDLYYWSSTTKETDASRAWVVDMVSGGGGTFPKWSAVLFEDHYHVWPVRGGNGYASGNW